VAASTIKTSARGWREVSSSATWTARCLWDTGTALYAVVQDTGATPKVRVMKADSRTAPTTWTEQDSGDSPAISNVDFPFDSWLRGSTLYVAYFTATNTVDVRTFDTGTDAWAASVLGAASHPTVVENEHTIRVVVRSDNDVLLFWTSDADDADLGWSRYEGASWTTAATGIRSLTNAGASSIVDAGIDSTDRAWISYFDVNATDIHHLTVNASNVLSSAAAVELSGPSATNQNAGARYNLYVDGTTDKIVVAYLQTGLILQERTVSLEADSSVASISAEVDVEATAADVGTRTPVSTAVVSGTPYAAWWDDASSGTIKYSTKSAGSWAAETNFATGITKLIEIVPVGTTELAVAYQSGSDVLFDWIVAPAGSDATGVVTTGTATATGQAATATAGALGTTIAATATAAGGTHTGSVSYAGAVTTGTAIAAGAEQTAAAGASGTTTAGTATATGGTQTGAAGALGTLTAGTATATGGAHTGTDGAGGGVTGTVTAGTATATGRTATAIAGAAASPTAGTATATGNAQAATAAAAGTLSAGTATATGRTVTGQAEHVGIVTAGSATASGGIHAGRADVSATIIAGLAAAAGKTVTGDANLFNVFGMAVAVTTTGMTLTPATAAMTLASATATMTLTVSTGG
jgi:hypothetical protein